MISDIINAHLKVSILIVSFRRDVEFVRYLLRSIRKFATGFHEVVVVVPRVDEVLFSWVETWGAKIDVFDESPGRGMLHHEVIKMTADLWCPEADVILNVDSDCCFWDACTPDDFLKDGKPILLRERYATVVNRLRLHWRTAVKAATGFDSEFETMVRMPIVHIRQVYEKTRAVIEAHTGRPFDSYILSCRNEFPQSYAEFPALGEVAARFFYDSYHWVDYRTETPDGGYAYTPGVDKLVARWSHGGFDAYRDQSEMILEGKKEDAAVQGAHPLSGMGQKANAV